MGKRTPEDQLQSDQNKKPRPSSEAGEAAAPVPEPQSSFAKLRQPPDGEIELSEAETEQPEEASNAPDYAATARPKYLDLTEAQLLKLHKPEGLLEKM